MFNKHCLSIIFVIFSYNRETALLKLICKMTPAPTEVNELKLFFPQITERNRHLRQVNAGRFEPFRLRFSYHSLNIFFYS